MAKVKTSDIDRKEKYHLVENLFDIISNLGSKKEAVDFLLGALTASEILMIARRVQTAEMILEEKSYGEIRGKSGVGYQNIANAQRLLQDENGGYRKQIEKHMSKKEKKNKKTAKIAGKGLLDRYPQHRFLKDLIR